jgi:DNA polymerase-3 subunit alpha
MIGYQTAYLKAHFPTEFTCALLNSRDDDIEKIAFLIEDASRQNINVLPPDINESLGKFTVVGKNTIRFGLEAIKNVGSNIIKAIIDERKRGGKFKDIKDLITRVKIRDLNKKSLEALIKSGALDSLEERGKLLFNLDKILKILTELRNESKDNQISLFGQSKADFISLKLENSKEASEEEKLLWEKEFIGLYISGHPLKKHSDFLQKFAIPIKKVKSTQFVGKTVKIGFILEEIRKINTKNGQPMLFVKGKDLSDSIEIVVFPKVLEETANVWQINKVVFAQGRIQQRNGEFAFLVSKAKNL